MICRILGAFDSIVLYVLLCLLCCGSVCLGAGERSLSTNGPREQVYSCVVHVHSEMSSHGRYPLEELTDIARGYGVDVVFLTDNLTDTIQYGLPPLRHILWLNYSRRSVMTVGPRAYLDAIEAENARQSDVLYIPGVEACPRFYWTGSFFERDAVCHDHQRNLIALGCSDPDVIKGIPETSGYVWPRDAVWVIGTRTLLALLCAGCAILLLMPRFLARRSPYTKREIRQSIVIGIILPVLVVVIVTNVCASFVPAFRLYGRRDSYAAGQRVMDYFNTRGIVHYWAHPEAADRHKFSASRGPRLLRCLSWIWDPSFDVDTQPYPEALGQTSGYTGFGGLYEDVNTLVEPGSAWDRVLNEYLAGRREQPAWCFGEMLYHYEGQAGKRLRNVETMVWAEERTSESLIGSLRDGRFYARRNRDDQRLSLDRWEVGPGKDDVVEVRFAISSPAAGEELTVTLVRNGDAVRRLSAKTPIRDTFLDHDRTSRPVYYRLVASGQGGLKLVANPLFWPSSKGQERDK